MSNDSLRDQILIDLARSFQKERRFRFWSRLILVVLLLAYASGLVWAIQGGSWSSVDVENRSDVAAMLRLNGMVGATRQGIDANQYIPLIRKAAKDGYHGLILQMNSPGGSPVHADRLYQAIRQVRDQHPDFRVVAVIEDLCASGCYYIAAASDVILTNPASIVGSIGVIMKGFEFTEAMQKLGIRRRVLTAGKNKDLFDPFKPMGPEDKKIAREILHDIHEQFVAAVRRGRGNRLKENKDLFTGRVWSGRRAIALGLVDGIGGTDEAMKILGVKKVAVLHPKRTWVDRLLAFRTQIESLKSLEALEVLTVQ